MPDIEELWDVSRFAEFCGVTDATVLRWIREKRIRAIPLPSGRPRIPRSAVDAMLRAPIGAAGGTVDDARF